MRSVTIVILAMLLSLSPARAQHAEARHDSLPQKPVRTGIWYTPVLRNTTVNGVAAGVYTSPAWRRDSLTVNGLNIEADPLPVIATPFAAVELFFHLPMILQSRHKYNKSHDMAAERKAKVFNDSVAYTHLQRRDTVAHTVVNGLSVSTGIIKSRTKVNGAAINAICAMENEMNGVEMSGLFNYNKSFRGVIAAPVNITTRGKGIQVGLVNRSKGGKLVQIGLLNTIGRRTTPLINFSLKRHPKPNDV